MCIVWIHFSVAHLTDESEEFTFDNSLVEDTTGRLLPNRLTVDNLTVEWLKKKTNELELSLKECQASSILNRNGVNKENK